MKLNVDFGTCILATSFLFVGCATSSQAKKENTASTIEYTLPVTQVTVGLDLVITKCEAPAEVKGAITLAASAIPSPYTEHYLRVSGPALTSFWKKHDLTIELHPNGAIKSVNGAVSDRSGAILINALKIAATFGSLLAIDGTSIKCNQDTWNAFDNAEKLRDRIKPLLNSLVNGSAKNVVETQKQIDVLAQNIAKIQSDHLSLRLEEKITILDKKQEGRLQWKADDLAQRFSVPTTGTTAFDLQWNFDAETSVCVPNCTIHEPYAPLDCADCPKTLVFREPRTVLLTVKMPEQKDVPRATLKFPMAQWGAITYFPLKARFGEAKSLKLALDEFGRRSAFTWASAARGEEITSAAGGILDAGAAYRAAQESEDTKAKKAEIDELETQKKWNALKRCEAIIEAGGTECPE